MNLWPQDQLQQEPIAPPVYNPNTKTFHDVKGSNFVVLHGNFNKSVELAKQYAGLDENDDNNKDFGRYNFLFNNCADYTNALLDVADIDGMSSQILSEGNTLISIPVLREFELSVSGVIDSGIKSVSDGLIYSGNSMIASNLAGNIVGNTLIDIGNFIDNTTNVIGDAVDIVTGVTGEVVDRIKHVAATATNAIADGAQKIWDWISFWG